MTWRAARSTHDAMSHVHHGEWCRACVAHGEAEATAAAEQRLRERIEALAVLSKGYRPAGMHDGLERARLSTLCDAIDELAALLAAPAAPRQGEPVDVEEQRSEALIELQRLRRLIVSYADLTHRVVQEGGDWREITAEWRTVVAEARAALSEPAEAGEPAP